MKKISTSGLTISIKDWRSKSTFRKKMYDWKMNHLNEFGTRRLVKIFCYNLIKWWNAICLDKKTLEKSVKIKKVNGKLNLKVSTPNTDWSIASCHETQNDLRAIKTISRNKSTSHPQVQEHKLQNPPKCYTRTLKC